MPTDFFELQNYTICWSWSHFDAPQNLGKIYDITWDTTSRLLHTPTYKYSNQLWAVWTVGSMKNWEHATESCSKNTTVIK